jgi:hypothetical protein
LLDERWRIFLSASCCAELSKLQERRLHANYSAFECVRLLLAFKVISLSHRSFFSPQAKSTLLTVPKELFRFTSLEDVAFTRGGLLSSCFGMIFQNVLRGKSILFVSLFLCLTHDEGALTL